MSGRARLCLAVRVRTQTGGHVGQVFDSVVDKDVGFRDLQDGDSLSTSSMAHIGF